MVRTKRLCFGLLVSALVLAACGTGRLVAPPEGPTSPPPFTDATSASAAVPSLQQYSNPDFGYSLSYPADDLLQSSFPHTVVFLAPASTPGHRERAWLTVQSTSEQNAEWFANQAKQANANLGIEITSSVQVLDGEQAYVLGGLSGQDLNRQVFIVHDGALYHLTFVPDDPARGEEYQQMEALYTAIIGSLRFLPERGAVPPVIDISNMMHELERALNARSAEAIAPLLGDEFVLGDLDPATPEGVTYARYASRDILPLILNAQQSPTPSLTLFYQVDWASVPGSLDTYAGIFPDEVVTPILAKGWGPDGAGQAVIIIGRRIDGSLFWRGAFVLH
jgi:hypothetical protein